MINLQIPSESEIIAPCITVFGVGGAGSNAVNNMIAANLEGAKFIVANTDSQALAFSRAEYKIQLGASLTKGLGAGASPETGKAAAEESIEEILKYLDKSNMVFVTAGMGGGTGTGAAPVIAKIAREKGILTVGVVTKPFNFEGSHRMKIAEHGLSEMQKHVDTLIVIPNQNLFRIATEKTTFADAFKMADDVLHSGVRGVTDLMTMPGLINLDFADIKSVMSEMGKAMMGTGEAEGEDRAIRAAESAIANPLLDHCSMKGAKGVLINITGGSDMTLFEVDEAANRIREEVDQEANIIFGSAFNPDLEGKLRVSVVATGIESESLKKQNLGKNIPNLKSFAKAPVRAETLSRSSSGSFLPPEAAEPNSPILSVKEEVSQMSVRKLYQETPNLPEIEQESKENLFMENSTIVSDLQKEIENEIFEDEKKQNSFKFNFFGGKAEKNSSSNNVTEKNLREEQFADEEIFDIPAYLRKNK